MQCIVYIDLNMVRAGVVKHPSEWPLSGYNEIQKPKRKNVLLDYNRLRELLGFENYERVQQVHRKWGESCLVDANGKRDDKWTGSVAVGSERFIQDIKVMTGGMALGRKPLKYG